MELIERGDTLTTIAESVARAKGRAGGCLVVEAPAGQGKTSVLRAAGAPDRADGLRVLTACGGELEADLPYSIVHQLFDDFLRAEPAGLREALFVDAAGPAAALFGYSPGPLSPASIDHALYWFVANLSERHALLIVVDDAQWADDASLRFLRHLAQRVADLPVLLLIGSRDAGVIVDARADTVRLGPLSQAGIGQLLARELHADVDAEFSRECVRVTGGNPFLANEIAANLRDSGVAPSRAAIPELLTTSPDKIRRSVLGRINRLGNRALLIARAIAILGPQARPPLIGALTGAADGETHASIDDLQREDILGPHSGVLGFVHPILRSVVEEDLGPSLRAAHHRRAADVLRDAGCPLESLVPHLLLSAPAKDPGVVETLFSAADAAMSAASPESAAHCLRRAIAEPAAPALLPRAYRRLGAALFGSNLIGEALDAYQSALSAVSDSPERNDIALEYGWLLMMCGLGDQARQILQNVSPGAAFAELQTAVQAALATAGLAAMDRPGDWAARLDAVERLPSTGADRQMFLANHAFAAMACGEHSAGNVIRIAKSALAEPIYPAHRFIIVNSLCPALTISDDAPEAMRVLDRAIEETTAEGDVGIWRYFMAMRARIAPEVGDLEGAEADARRVLELEAHDPNPGPPLAAAMLVEVLLDRGHVDEAGAVGEALTDPPPFGIMQHFVLVARGRLRRHQRRYDEALVDLTTSGRLLTEHGYDNPGFLLWRTEAALAFVDIGNKPEAARLVHEHLTLAEQFGAPRAIGVGLWVRAMTEAGSARISTLTEADRVLKRSATVLPRIRVQLDLGAALCRGGRRGEAVSYLEAALDAAARCHADGLAVRAGDELAVAGVAARRPARGRTGLTASELRVANYAVEGLTNPQIAQALFVSRRTVELHLTNAFRKLGIEGREQLGTALAGQV